LSLYRNSPSHIVDYEHPEICTGLLLIANVRLEIAIRDARESDILELLVVYNNELLPMLITSLGQDHPYSLLAKGYCGIATFSIGKRDQAKEMILECVYFLTTNASILLPECHQWIKKLKNHCKIV
jgi:hypothetical protein